MEVDLRDPSKKKRTVHWFVNGFQSKISFCNLPASIKMGFVFKTADTSLEFASFEELKEPTFGSKRDGLEYEFEGDAI